MKYGYVYVLNWVCDFDGFCFNFVGCIDDSVVFDIIFSELYVYGIDVVVFFKCCDVIMVVVVWSMIKFISLNDKSFV